MKPATDFASLCQLFFSKRLLTQRKASPHTVSAYAQTFRLLMAFAQKRLGVPPSKLSLAKLDAPFISDFLDDLLESAVTNARFASFHGLSVASYASRPRPFHSAKPRARHERHRVGRVSGGLPSAARRRRCAPTPFPPSLRLRSTVSARRPQTEAKQERFDHAFVLSKLTQRIE
jgi:hypothetical protein